MDPHSDEKAESQSQAPVSAYSSGTIHSKPAAQAQQRLLDPPEVPCQQAR